jgi:hypothetical protein
MRTIRFVAVLALGLAAVAACSSESKDPYVYARSDISCMTAADCCVAFDGCKATGLVVAKGDYAKVQGLLADPANKKEPCVKCIAPAIQVVCEGGKCAGKKVDGDPTALTALAKDHCGDGVVPMGATLGTKAQTIGCQ